MVGLRKVANVKEEQNETTYSMIESVCNLKQFITAPSFFCNSAKPSRVRNRGQESWVYRPSRHYDHSTIQYLIKTWVQISDTHQKIVVCACTHVRFAVCSCIGKIMTYDGRQGLTER